MKIISVLIIGKSASGKTTIVNELVNKYGFKKIVETTTRPFRDGEKQGVDYNFVTSYEFRKKIEENYFTEWKSYTTTHGVWYYGVSSEELEKADDKSLIILPPDRCKKIIEQVKERPTLLYIYSNSNTIKKRLEKRGDKREEITRRIKADNTDFKNVEKIVDKIFYNNEDEDVNDVVNKIVEYLLNEEVSNK